jgi:hypothetical protein
VEDMISGKISFQDCLYPSDGTGITHSHGIATAYKIQEAAEVSQ